MKKVLLTIVPALLLLAACIKPDDNPEPSCDTGIIRYTNTSNNPYKIYLDGGTLEVLQGGTHVDKEVSKGNHAVKAIQQSGYVFYPTEKSADVLAPGCGDVEFIFP